ncbi:MAG: glycosyltransferase family 4 protein [Verrucomicrobiota bacterium]|nr:glycosyltransferase family 4 protein [Verrucomicrobiota bacterium]
MKILLGSHHFYPSIGGIETASDLLAREFVKLGHEVRVITQTKDGNDFPFRVIRRSGPFNLLQHVAWCDVFIQNNISLRTLWPLLFARRPLFIAHQTWITDASGRIGWQHRLKLFVLRFAKSFAISDAIAEQLPMPSVKVGNPYNDQVFKDFHFGDRTRDLIYIGRLVSDKGVDVLINALSILRESGIAQLTVAGDGPERARLEKQVAELGLQSSVQFIGSQTSRQLAEILNRHRILVVPSRWREPFGIVALEAIACGCVVVGSGEGGLAEAIGPCGSSFPNGDSRALAKILAQLLRDPMQCEGLRRSAAEHLARFTPRHVANIYLEAMKSAR